MAFISWLALAVKIDCGAKVKYDALDEGEFLLAMGVIVWLAEMIFLGVYLMAWDKLNTIYWTVVCTCQHLSR